MSNPDRRQMLGLAECPGCHHELVAPLGAGGKPAKCGKCGCRFLLPSADTLFNNAAVYLMANEVEESEHEAKTKRQIRFFV